MKCLCCDSNNIDRKGQKSNYEIFHCKNCGFEFVYPLPDYEQIENHYDKTRVSKDIKKLIWKSIYNIQNNPNNPKHDWFDRIFDIVKKYTNKDKLDILELGSAYGYFVHYANTKGYNAVCTESTKKYASSSKGIIKGEILYIEDNLYDKYFDDNSFDLIYMEHVFEHIIEPRIVMEKLKPLLRKNGIIFMSLPKHKSLLSRMFGLKWNWTCPPDHLYYYNKEALIMLLNKYDLKILQSWTGDYFFRSIYQFYSFDNLINKLKRFSNKYINTNCTIKNHSYKYPRNFVDIFTLMPYWFLFPIIILLNKFNLGSELIVIVRKNNN
ncbi:MAG: class I SAM-dependent methyltransferase [Candidatus Atribacteria bacterium]